MFVLSFLILLMFISSSMLGEKYALLGIMVLFAAINASSLLKDISKEASQHVFLKGMFILIVMELALMLLKVY